MAVHPSSVIDPSARLGSNVTVGPFVVIGPDTVIGDRCQIISHAVIEYTDLGAGSVVYPHASLGLPPQHLLYKNEKTRLVIGENCVFREGVTVHRGTILDKGVTHIGNNGYFMALSHVAHDCVIGDDVILANGAQMAGHVQLGNRCFVSALVGLHQRIRVGSGSLISGGAMVPQDVVPFAIAQGDRAVLRGINLVGMKRAGIDRDSIKLIKKAYRIIFYSDLTITEALKNPALQINNPHVAQIRKFLSEPNRGFIRPPSNTTPEASLEEALT